MMDMGSSTMAMPMPTATDSSSMPMSSSTDMTMTMVFFTSTKTPLWSHSFTPESTGQYAGVCIFLIAFAIIFRLLVALRVNIFRVLAALERRQQGGGPLLSTYTAGAGKGASSCAGSDGGPPPRPWRAGDTMMTATLDMAIAGLSYLLMLAVMTMNVGYFLSILAGVFVGSVVCGHWTGSIIAH
ncbi:hypothetical protein NLU13_4004 [Sarocladium strictum]|uniref:Copper transport protein n=1 Tax=Sarocladium strictum TaxID=5046 RepID=A0AA39GJR8_SARSR|nr:hypothetical protein NLU13_4004 [Sarocladium strictum]